MDITRERPCQRRYHRLTAPLSVIFEGQDQVTANDWAIGGLSAHFSVGELPNYEDDLEIGLMLPFQGYNISFHVIVTVVRVDYNERCLGLKFKDLPERSLDLLSYFSEDLIRGKMGTVADSICRIDIPVTPISTEPSTNHITETPVSRLPVKTIIMSALYILLGVFVFSYMAVLIYSNFMRLEVTSSVVTTELQTLKMPIDGIIKNINYEKGAYIQAGDEILRIENIILESKIKTAKLKVEDTKKSLWRIEQRHLIEKERMKLYRIVNRTDKNIAQARLYSFRESLKAADAHFLRMKKLLKSGATTKMKFERARKDQFHAEASVKEAELILEKNTAMDIASERRHYNHKEFTTDLDLMALDREMAYSNLLMEMSKLENLLDLKNTMVIKAPFNGRIVHIYQSSQTNALRNTPVLLLERVDNMTVTAYLNQKEILEIGLYNEAKIYIPAVNKHLSATITKIDRSSSVYLHKNKQQYTWHDAKERTATVLLTLNKEDISPLDIGAGFPVVVIFERQVTSDIWAKLKSIFTTTQISNMTKKSPPKNIHKKKHNTI